MFMVFLYTWLETDHVAFEHKKDFKTNLKLDILLHALSVKVLSVKT